jgi:hypothetical protein
VVKARKELCNELGSGVRFCDSEKRIQVGELQKSQNRTPDPRVGAAPVLRNTEPVREGGCGF